MEFESSILTGFRYYLFFASTMLLPNGCNHFNQTDNANLKSEQSMKRDEPVILNPEGILQEAIRRQLRLTTKDKPLWARKITESREIKSMEGRQEANPGDYLCRGISGEFWPQSEKTLFASYAASGQRDEKGFERFDPKPDAPLVEAAQVPYAFRVVANWGELTGKAGDYLVRRVNDVSDVWVVDQEIFRNSYKPIEP